MSRRRSALLQDSETIAGLARGLRVLEAFNEGEEQMTLSEVARLTSISPAAVRRSLRTLASLGYVSSVDRHFLLSARVLLLGSAYLRSANIERMLMPELHRLVGLFGDTAGIAVLAGTNVIYIAHHCTPRGRRPVAGAGVTYPAYATSLGRVLLASLDERALDEYFATAHLDKLTALTEVNPKHLRAILRQVRKQGFATIVDQLFYGVTSLTVPIVNATGETIAALNTSVYTGQMTAKDLVKTRLSELRKSSEQLTQIISSHPVLQQSLQIAPERKRDIPKLPTPT
jgi:IclR family pca regulon transcriptional regulator